MKTDALAPALLLVVVFAIGIRSTWRLWQQYRRIGPFVQRRNRLLAQSFVVTCLLVLFAVGYFAIRTVTRLAGFDSPEWITIISYVVSTPVLLLPVYLEYVWNRIGAR